MLSDYLMIKIDITVELLLGLVSFLSYKDLMMVLALPFGDCLLNVIFWPWELQLAFQWTSLIVETS